MTSNESMEDKIKWIRPDSLSRCTWTPDQPNSTSPHFHLVDKELLNAPKIVSSILQCINNTPLVKLDRIAQKEGLKCELLGKCEFFNAGGSVKDRIGIRMIEEAERDGLLLKGDTIIEPTSGNTGIGLALACAVKGYRCIIVMPDKMSNEKEFILRALGTEIIRTPTAVPLDSKESHICTAWKIHNEIPRSHILDQYRNPYNPIAHFDTTAEEILLQCESKLDMIIISVGTGGTLTGISRKFKQVIPECKIIGVDPHGSILAEPESLNSEGTHFYQVEGIGYDFIPTVLDRRYVDLWVKTSDQESLIMARRLIREEGLLCGGSSGSAMVAALKEAKKLSPGQRCVVILPDSIRNYMTKHLNDNWMIENRLIEPEHEKIVETNLWWWNLPISKLKVHIINNLSSNATCTEIVRYFNSSNNVFGIIPILENARVLGVVRASKIICFLRSGETTNSISTLIEKDFISIQYNSTLGDLSKILENHSYAICLKDKALVGIIAHVEFLAFVSSIANP